MPRQPPRPTLTDEERAERRRIARTVPLNRRIREILAQAAEPLKSRLESFWEELLFAVVAGGVAAVMVLLKMETSRPLFESFFVACFAVAATFASVIAILFVFHLIRAPKRWRMANVKNGEDFFNAQLIGRYVPPKLDQMQVMAGIVASTIDQYFEQQKNTHRTPQPSDRKRVTTKIENLWVRAETDPYITRVARKRALELHSKIKDEADLGRVRDLCRAFCKLKPKP